MLLTEYQSLITEWDYSKNKGVDPTKFTAGSSKKVWWSCAYGHSWEATVKNRTSKGSGCPYCNNKLAWAGSNDLATLYPHLKAEWNYAKNVDLDPSNLLPRSNKKAWWQCSKGHEWEAPIATRTRTKPTGCPVCAGQKVAEGYNDLKSQYPELVKEWHSEKNPDIDLAALNKGTDKTFWWKCEKGHEWQARVVNRARMGQGCPHCSGRLTTVGATDIATTHPHLLEEWDYTKNTIDPEDVSYGSARRVWWTCAKGHSWETVVRYRAKNGAGCPTCWSKTFVSKAESELLEYIQTLQPDAIGTYKGLEGVSEVDIYIPSKNMAIEYNGIYFHSERTKPRDYHYKKWLVCKNLGIQLIQVWEDEWINQKDLVKRMLAHKLGVSSAKRVYARNTVITQVGADIAEHFLTNNHIQGYASGSIRIGLEHDGELVALALFKKRTETEIELVRYATSCTVVGGQGKILKHLTQVHPETQEVVTFADHCVSDGNLYESLNFKKDSEIRPDYKYLVNNTRVHKFNYRLKKFKNDPDLIYREGLTESELANLNGLKRVYDAGKTRYVLST